MMGTYQSNWRSTWLMVAAGGPLVLGAALGVPFGVRRIVTESVLLPGLVIGLSLMMAPALYIGMSLAGAAPPASRVAAAVGRGLRASGTTMAGLAPATAFLLSTTLWHGSVYVFGLLAVGGAMLAGIHALWRALGTDAGKRARAIAVFGVWSAVSLGLGTHLFISMLGA